jgi:cytochrome c553
MEPVKSATDLDPQLVSAGGEIARNGLPEQNVPACLTCHGEATARAMPSIARLHGQDPVYLENRLAELDGPQAREVGAISPMWEIAEQLTDDQRTAVAAWFAAQEPLSKTALAAAEPERVDGQGGAVENGGATPGDAAPTAGDIDTEEGEPAPEESGDGSGG